MGHNEIDPNFGQSYADAYDAYLTAQRESRHLTGEDLIAEFPPWPSPGRGRRAKS